MISGVPVSSGLMTCPPARSRQLPAGQLEPAVEGGAQLFALVPPTAGSGRDQAAESAGSACRCAPYRTRAVEYRDGHLDAGGIRTWAE